MWKVQPQTLNPVLDLFASAARGRLKHSRSGNGVLGAVSSLSVVLGYLSHLLSGFKTSEVIKPTVSLEQALMETVSSLHFFL